jgi:TatD DNase family protein
MFQTQVFKQQLELARQLQRPASVHCVSAFADLQEILRYVPHSFYVGIPIYDCIDAMELKKSMLAA